MIWTVTTLATSCGSCRDVIPADAPVLLVTAARLRRCATCAVAMGVAVDQVEVDHERFRLEREAQAAPTRVGRPSEPYRHRPVRQPLPLSAIAGSFFDSKAAASGDRDE